MTATVAPAAIQCAVPGCSNPACVEACLVDYYPSNHDVFCEQDSGCGHLCEEHLLKNEQQSRGERMPRGITAYPFTNRGQANGWTGYRRLTGVKLGFQADWLIQFVAAMCPAVNDYLRRRGLPELG